MTLDEIIQNRRSVRQYQSTPVSLEDLERIADAGRHAPSAVNAQTWTFTMVQDAALRKELSDACYGQIFLEQAPVVLVVSSFVDKVMECGQSAATMDCSIAMTHMLLKATELGLGTCWIGAFSPFEVKKVLQLPTDSTVVALSPIGYASETPIAPPRKSLHEVMVVK